jgi:hypothetical protein
VKSCLSSSHESRVPPPSCSPAAAAVLDLPAGVFCPAILPFIAIGGDCC